MFRATVRPNDMARRQMHFPSMINPVYWVFGRRNVTWLKQPVGRNRLIAPSRISMPGQGGAMRCAYCALQTTNWPDSKRQEATLPAAFTRLKRSLPSRAASAAGPTATCATTRTDRARAAGGAAARVGSTASACAARFAGLRRRCVTTPRRTRGPRRGGAARIHAYSAAGTLAATLAGADAGRTAPHADADPR
jgi:hypothetical protein